MTLSCVVGTGDASASGAAAETLTSPATNATATVAGEVSAAEVAAAKRSAAATRGERRATTRSVAPKASGGVVADQTTSAVQTAAPSRPARVRATVSRFTLSSRTWRTGSAAPKISLRIAARKATAARVQVRIENTRRRVIARQSLGVIESGVTVTKTLTKRISSRPGSYRLRLIVRDATGRKTRARARALRVTESAEPTAPASVTTVGGYAFPVHGACNFRSLSSQEFHASRSGGRLHNGHDIGTFSDYPPVVAVTAGTVERIWFDENGGGWTIVFNGDDGIAYGYLHLKPDTIAVKVGDRVIFGKWSGTEVKINGEALLIMKESDIMGVLEGSAATSKAA